MPDRMSNGMSEDMSDRMPEDLPVRKCINVMVGITRSKVIFCIGFRFCFTFCYSLEVGLRHFTILYGTFISFIVMVLGITWPVAENFEAQQLMIWRPAASNDSKDLF